jgi:hypothetical protein
MPPRRYYTSGRYSPLSWAGLTRASIKKDYIPQSAGCRVKPGNDEKESIPPLVLALVPLERRFQVLHDANHRAAPHVRIRFAVQIIGHAVRHLFSQTRSR